MTDSVVTTHELTKTYGPRAAVDGLSLTVHQGEVYGFLGPNGAGKTTTLRMLLGLIRPTHGSATVLGQHPGSPEALAGVGALVEEPGFYPYLSGRDNLRLLARYAGLDDVAVGATLEQVDLAGRASDKFKSYSLGMKQRLGVAAALLGEPELLVLDEPTNGLDPAGMSDMRDLVRTLAAGGQTVMLSSHLLGEVQEICDRVGVISNGRLITESTVAELRGTGGLRVRAEPVDSAAKVARGLLHEQDVTIVDRELHLNVDARRAPEITRALVRADVDVLEIKWLERTLEDVFFEITTQEATS